MKAAFVHDWLVTWRGGEKVLEALLELFPDAPIYTLFYDPVAMPETIRQRRIVTPALTRHLNPIRKALLPALPHLIESFDLSQFDLIISTSSCVAKGCIPKRGARHLCYIHSPMRYVWDQKEHYLGSVLGKPVIGPLVDALCKRLQSWDVQSAGRVDRFIANSTFVAKRVRLYYERDSVVVYPPIALESFFVDATRRPINLKDRYFIAAGAWVSYKRFDLALEACRLAGAKLVVMGSGPDEGMIRRAADQPGARVEVVLSPSDDRWRELFQGAEAFIFPGTEDFGMTAIEALACGTPVIAHASGGALDFVIPGRNGFFFRESQAEALAEVIRRFDKMAFEPNRVAQTAQRFSRKSFLDAVREQLKTLLESA